MSFKEYLDERITQDFVADDETSSGTGKSSFDSEKKYNYFKNKIGMAIQDIRDEDIHATDEMIDWAIARLNSLKSDYEGM